MKAISTRLQAIEWDFATAKTDYLTHNLHPYPAKFIPQIPSALIEELSSPRETVADIFCGSGTTLLEALQLKHQAIGIDANPLAALISKAKTTPLAQSEFEELAAHRVHCQHLLVETELNSGDLFYNGRPFQSAGWRPDPKMCQFWFKPHVVEELAELRCLIDQVPSEAAHTLCAVVFSAIIVAVSKQDSDTRYVRREKPIKSGGTVRRYLAHLDAAVSAVRELTDTLNGRSSCRVLNANILEAPETEPFDLVITSPPYPNAYSYHLYHRTRLLWLGYEPEQFKRIEIGSHRKYSAKGRNRATAATFRAEFEQIFQWLRNRLRDRRHACFVIGDSTLNGARIDNASLIAEAGASVGFREIARIQRSIAPTRKSFNPKIGKIKTENILICRKYNEMGFLTCRIKGYIQPFERQLALQELRALSPGDVIPVDGDEASASLFSVPDAANLGTLRNALAYWQEVGTEPDGLTIQIRREATWISAQNRGMFNGLIPSVPAKLPKKRCLRYATHGLHEYRGKFFPQLVRALINIAQVPDNGIVLDPMCGSGTTLVETRLAGRTAYGLDMNPLSVFIARVKCQALALDVESLMGAYETLREALCTSPDQTTRKYFASLPRDDQAYLERWFAAQVLMELDQVVEAIRRLPEVELQNFYQVCLSNILRGVSWQKNDDLRVRKQVVEFRTGEVIERFLNEALRSTKIVAAFLSERSQEDLGPHSYSTRGRLTSGYQCLADIARQG